MCAVVVHIKIMLIISATFLERCLVGIIFYSWLPSTLARSLFDMCQIKCIASHNRYGKQLHLHVTLA